MEFAMASFPKIESPCPLRVTALPSPGKDFCSMCERKVHNLSAMSQFERSVFMRSCTGKVCVAYSIPAAGARTLAMTGASLGMALLLGAGTALAGDAGAPAPFDPASKPESLLTSPADGRDCDELDETEIHMILMTGGISSPQDAEWVDDSTLAEIPIITAEGLLDDGTATAMFGADPADSDPGLR
jgi:hypothetical protein